jgi:hypothetical protein
VNLEFLKEKVESLSGKEWKYHNFGPDTKGGFDRVGIVVNNASIMNGLAFTPEIAEQARLAAISPELILELIKHVQHWRHVAHKMYIRTPINNQEPKKSYHYHEFFDEIRDMYDDFETEYNLMVYALKNIHLK